MQRGDLRSWASDLDLLRHEVQGKLLLPVDWSPMQDLDLTTVPTDGREHDPVLYMEDSAWPHESMLDTYLDKARTHYAPSLEERTARSLLTLLGVFQAALGAPRRREVVLWQRVDFPDRLPALFTRELPVHVKGPGTWMHDALEVRDDWESRLLRSAAWSPALRIAAPGSGPLSPVRLRWAGRASASALPAGNARHGIGSAPTCSEL